MSAIRLPAVAGTFYPAEPDTLRRQIAGFLAEAGNAPPAAATPKAIIGPHAGYVYSGPVAARAYARLAAARGTIERVVLIGPSHHVGFQGLAVDTASAWAMPSGTVPLDSDAIARLRELPMVDTLDAAYAREHALEVHVPFLQHVLGAFRLFPIVAGDAPQAVVAAALDALWGGPETLIVVSTDLSHYLDYAACQDTDTRTAAAIERLDPDGLAPQLACGVVPMRGLLATARRRAMTIERLDLRNSGDTAGGRDRVVGYGAWALYEASTAVAADDERAAVEAVGPTLLQLAHEAIVFGLNTGQAPQVVANGALAPRLAAPGAAFVTLRRRGALRGCVGSAIASRPLFVDVAQHAFNAAFLDWRFPRLGFDELAELSLSVSVLTPPALMSFADEADLLAQLRPGVDGLLIESAGRVGLFLPSVWEEIGEGQGFLAALKRKAGIDAPLAPGEVAARRFRSIEVKGQVGAPPLAQVLTRPDQTLGWRLLPFG